jgi:AsmA protein
MPETSTPAEAPARPRRNYFSFGFALLYLFIACIIALAVLPPLLNVNRFKRRIVTSISTSLGRPVHLDSVTLVLLPLPGFKLENFVVAEDPAFGSEPVIRANEVQATLRIPSLYSKKVEFSRISLKEPSINLVHAANGHWNVESILLKAAQISAAPTAQATAGPDPRFPYVEATDARVNIKSGLEKLPFSLTEADFSLWLPQPSQWRVRISGKPTRTDTSASDTGILSLEGTLGRAERFDLIPIDLAAEWKNAPLGEASRVLIGNDAGVRGELRLSATLRGTVGTGILKSSIDLRGLRRADFVPDQPINLRADCQATAAETFHALHESRCSWPPPGEPTLLALTGDLPNIHNPASASFQLGTPGLPAATLLQWLRAASPRVSPDIIATGTLTGSVSRSASGEQPGAPSMQSHRMGGTYDSPVLSGHLALNSFTLSKGPLGNTAIAFGDTTITSAPSAAGFVLSPTTLALGGKEPASLEGHFDSFGYSLHLTGNVLPSRLLALTAAVPQFGDGLPALFLPPSAPQPPPSKELPIHIDLTSIRTWSGGQTWTRTTPAKPTHPKPYRR